jgi:hypothetical protein
VRSITCWSISRYSRWIVDQKPDAYFKPVLFAVLKLVMDPNKKVQAAACTALVTLEEAAGPQLLTQFAHPIIQTIAQAITMYSVCFHSSSNLVRKRISSISMIALEHLQISLDQVSIILNTSRQSCLLSLTNGIQSIIQIENYSHC